MVQLAVAKLRAHAFFDNQPIINFTPLLPVTGAADVDQCAGFTEAIAIATKSGYSVAT